MGTQELYAAVGKLGDKILAVVEPHDNFQVAIEAMLGAIAVFIETAPSGKRNLAEEYVKKSFERLVRYLAARRPDDVVN